MKIRSQDVKRLVELGECYIDDAGSNVGVYVKSRFGRDAVLCGVYEDEARAKGIMHEICLADAGRERVFYMPLE